ncbi:PhzF family phenazine biosynthesis protein [Engelhardtia mirabilis]|uniref:Putative isomerase YddE n=1 Tax=Engelhardtia mirabilis TaxID=2528011 RepID=A0A518BR98_9BACT|nr:putative isomerase YddE [Planctomycetes bacterium Pla133]QDV03820.1 putative isomerase YddE [Planctomycetes bacterium Pla86]
MSGQPIAVVDAFTDRAYRGNPAAVCVLETDRDAEWMQAVAREMNLSETAFLRREGDTWRLRWFTPTTEVRLCGHATLASAHWLWEAGLASAERIAFETLSGRLVAARAQDAIDLDFPARPAARATAPPRLLGALGLAAGAALTVAGAEEDWLVEVADEAALRGVAPDFGLLAKVDARGVIVTARAGEGSEVDFLSRFFAPACGVDEDPVTGSAHCTLGPFWAARIGRSRLRAHQASARGGDLEVELRGERVGLIGRAVTTLSGELLAQ